MFLKMNFGRGSKRIVYFYTGRWKVKRLVGLAYVMSAGMIVVGAHCYCHNSNVNMGVTIWAVAAVICFCKGFNIFRKHI